MSKVNFPALEKISIKPLNVQTIISDSSTTSATPKQKTKKEMTRRQTKARATVMELEMQRRVHPPTVKITGCPDSEFVGSYSIRGEEVHGAPLYESHHKCRQDRHHFYIFKANDGDSGLEWLITRNQSDIETDKGQYRSAAAAVSPYRVALWERVRYGMMGMTVRWEVCSEMHVTEPDKVSSICAHALFALRPTHRDSFVIFLGTLGGSSFLARVLRPQPRGACFLKE
jgi:hypothetical protein